MGLWDAGITGLMTAFNDVADQYAVVILFIVLAQNYAKMEDLLSEKDIEYQEQMEVAKSKVQRSYRDNQAYIEATKTRKDKKQDEINKLKNKVVRRPAQGQNKPYEN